MGDDTLSRGAAPMRRAVPACGSRGRARRRRAAGTATSASAPQPARRWPATPPGAPAGRRRRSPGVQRSGRRGRLYRGAGHGARHQRSQIGDRQRARERRAPRRSQHERERRRGAALEDAHHREALLGPRHGAGAHHGDVAIGGGRPRHGGAHTVGAAAAALAQGRRRAGRGRALARLGTQVDGRGLGGGGVLARAARRRARARRSVGHDGDDADHDRQSEGGGNEAGVRRRPRSGRRLTASPSPNERRSRDQRAAPGWA